MLNYWATMGIINLIILTWDDYKNNRLVDDRKNYFMMGLSISLISHYTNKWWYLLILLIVVTLLNLTIKKYELIGAADNNTITWMFLGYGIISAYKLMIFFVIYSVIAIFIQILKEYVFKYDKPIPYYGFLLISFIFGNYVLGTFTI